MAVDTGTAHRVMNQLVQESEFCEEDEGRWNTRLHFAMEAFKFVGDIVRLNEEELYRRTQLGQNTMARLKAFLARHGLNLGMTGSIVDTWVRPTS